MDRIRTDVENLLLSEMVEEDIDFVMREETIPMNTQGSDLFGDTSSSEDDLDSILNGDDFDLF
jgi:hypothetical protein